jgi:pyridoxal phosphate enzyme (YggS family)
VAVRVGASRIAVIDIAANVRVVRDRIAEAARRGGRSPDDIRLIGVSKGQPASAVIAAYAAGLRDFGENRVQEASAKVGEVREQGCDARWHMVGHLQQNKVRAALEVFDILHSVDSERIAEAIAARATKRVPVLLEVNVGGEASKFGVQVADVGRLAERATALPNLDVLGLMTVAPAVADPEEARPVFRELCRLRDELGLRELSMGMTDDFEVAIEEGATLVRVGRAIFGPREG